MSKFEVKLYPFGCDGLNHSGLIVVEAPTTWDAELLVLSQFKQLYQGYPVTLKATELPSNDIRSPLFSKVIP